MSRGGKRKGAGRPRGKGPWGEETKPLRIPLSLLGAVTKFLEKRGYRLPLYVSRVPAGTPSAPVEDIERIIDINALLVKQPENCFLLRVSGDSMINAGIHDGDMLVVDRSQEPTNGKIVVAMLDAQATVKRFKRDKGKIFLMPENESYQPIIASENLEISGVVTGIIRKL